MRIAAAGLRMLLVLALASPCVVSGAAPGTALDRYLDGLRTLRADFTQTVYDARGKAIEQGEGRLSVERPGKFRWDYAPRGAGADAGQLLVADGARLWFYERDLAQVTVKPLDDALSSTPMMLLSGTAAQLAATFTLQSAPRRESLEWVVVTPRGAGADFSRAELGFHGTTLQRMIISDRLGQVVTLQFARSQRNATLGRDVFNFSPPPGVDVIGAAR